MPVAHYKGLAFLVISFFLKITTRKILINLFILVEPENSKASSNNMNILGNT